LITTSPTKKQRMEISNNRVLSAPKPGGFTLVFLGNEAFDRIE
jgi:hypothetical protein